MALNVLESILLSGTGEASDPEEEEEEEEAGAPGTQPHLKQISVNELLFTAGPVPNILDILSKAKIKEESGRGSQLDVVPRSPLENAIINHFTSTASSSSTGSPATSLKSFTAAVCKFLQENPQQLAAIHRQLFGSQ